MSVYELKKNLSTMWNGFSILPSSKTYHFYMFMRVLCWSWKRDVWNMSRILFTDLMLCKKNMQVPKLISYLISVSCLLCFLMYSILHALICWQFGPYRGPLCLTCCMSKGSTANTNVVFDAVPLRGPVGCDWHPPPPYPHTILSTFRSNIYQVYKKSMTYI
jgi:hypothetical protein